MFNAEKIQSNPRHPKDKDGICLIVGSHPDWEKDFDEAYDRAMNTDLAVTGVCAINDATHLVRAEYMATNHPEKLDQFLQGVDHKIELHTRKKMRRPAARDNEYIWNINLGGSSALFAVGAMLGIGFEKVVLCGCPLDGGGGYAVKRHNGSVEDPRVGELPPNSDIVLGYKENLKKFKYECKDADRVYSMSGTTQKIFGDFE